VFSSTPRPHFTPGKDPVPIVQEAGWAPGPVWTGGKSRPHRDSIPDRPARSQTLYRLSYRAHNIRAKPTLIFMKSALNFLSIDRKLTSYMGSLSEVRYEFSRDPPARGRDIEKFTLVFM